MTLAELKSRNIPYWPDNDGGLWYWDADGNRQRVVD